VLFILTGLHLNMLTSSLSFCVSDGRVGLQRRA
jgi:hypothetical protein